MNELEPFTKEQLEHAKATDWKKYAEMYKIYWEWRKRAKENDKKEILSTKNKLYRFKNKEKIKEINKKWREKNPEKVKKYLKEYYKRNKERYKNWNKEWRDKKKKENEVKKNEM